MSVQVNCWFICHARTLNSAQQLNRGFCSVNFLHPTHPSKKGLTEFYGQVLNSKSINPGQDSPLAMLCRGVKVKYL